MRTIGRKLSLLGAALLWTACAAAPPGESFEDVRSLVQDRAGRRVEWNRDAPAGARTDEAVRQLLAAELTRDGAVQIALLNNRRLQEAFEDLGVAEAAVVGAGTLRNPRLSGNAKWFPGGGEEIEFDVTRAFLDLFTLPVRGRAAEADLEAAKHAVAAAVLDLGAEVERTFVRAQAAEQTLEMRRMVVDAAGAAAEAAQRIRDAGNLTALELANHRALLEEAKLDLREAEAALEAERERLTRLLGVSGPDTGWRIAPRLEDLPAEDSPPEELERRAVGASLALAAGRHRIEAQGARAGIAGWASVFDGAEAGLAVKKEAEGDWGIGPALAIPLPLFDQGRAEAAATRSDLRRLLAAHTALAVELRSEVRAARARLLAKRDRAEYFRAVVLPLRGRIVQDTQLRYNAMQAGVFELLAAKREEIEAGGGYVEALRDAWIARIDLRNLLRGGGGTGSLAGGSEAARIHR